MIQNPTLSDVMSQISTCEQMQAREIAIVSRQDDSGSKFYEAVRASQRPSVVIATSDCTDAVLIAMFNSCKDL